MNRDELVVAYLDNELSSAERAAFEASLSNDESLRAEVESIRLINNALNGLPVPAPTAQLRRRVLEAVAKEPTPHSWLDFVKGVRLWLVPVGVAAGMMFFMMRSPVERNEPELESAAGLLDILEDYEVADLQAAEDIEAVASLDELGADL